MLKIRLQRIGRKNDPAYRVVVAEHTIGPRSGKFVERLGSYNPKTKERILNGERIQYWLSVGAQASGTVHNMLVTEGIVKGSKVNVLPKKTVPAKEEESAAEKPAAAEAAAPAAEEAEAPAEASSEASAKEEEAPAAEAEAEEAPEEPEEKKEE